MKQKKIVRVCYRYTVTPEMQVQLGRIPEAERELLDRKRAAEAITDEILRNWDSCVSDVSWTDDKSLVKHREYSVGVLMDVEE